jgi:hypothetical protein
VVVRAPPSLSEFALVRALAFDGLRGDEAEVLAYRRAADEEDVLVGLITGAGAAEVMGSTSVVGVR